mgnify:CR=1 FL=1
MEDLINSIPKEVNNTGLDKDGIRVGNGFCLRYSVARQKWLCGYSLAFKGKKDDKYSPWVEADDPVEAVSFFVDLISKAH